MNNEKSEANSCESRKCPHCAEEIKIEAKVCKHCGRSLIDKDGNDPNYPLMAFFVGLFIGALGLKQAWGPAYTAIDLWGILLVGGSIVGGVFALIAKLFKR